jgi:Domain of unknown function (DUF4384)
MLSFKRPLRAFFVVTSLLILPVNALAGDEVTRSVHIIEPAKTAGPSEFAPVGRVPAPQEAAGKPNTDRPASNESQNFSGTLTSFKAANPAELSVEMLPGQAVSIGSNVSFRITAKKAGYLILVDIDSAGKIAQIYPNTALAAGANRPKSNYMKAGVPFLTPSSGDSYAGVAYKVSPPAGEAMVVAILSERPVQMLDLPDIPLEIKGQTQALDYLTRWITELRIAETETGRLRETNWSFNAKPYAIKY